MKQHWYRVAVCALLTAFGASVAHCQAPKVRWNAPPEEWQWVVAEEVPGTTHGVVHSQAMQRDVGYNIYLPPSYATSPSRRYPVVYFLHGAGGSERSDADPSLVRRLIREEKLGEVIYVYPNGGQFSRYRDWPEANVKTETFFIKELLPHIDATYRTIQRREGRALSGWSMGGDAALRFAFKYPDLFCAAGSFSAAIDWGAEADDSIMHYSRQHVKQIQGKVGVMLTVGEDDRLFTAHQTLLPHLDELGIEYTFRPVAGVGHNLGQMKQQLGEAVTLMLATHYAPATEEAANEPVAVEK